MRMVMSGTYGSMARRLLSNLLPSKRPLADRPADDFFPPAAFHLGFCPVSQREENGQT